MGINIKLSLPSILAVLLLFTATSCDPHGGYEFWLDNKSDSVIYVVHRKAGDEKLIKMSVAPKARNMFLSYITISGLYDHGKNFLRSTDSLGIYVDTVQLQPVTKDYYDRTSWHYNPVSTSSVGRSGTNIYTLEITNADVK